MTVDGVVETQLGRGQVLSRKRRISGPVRYARKHPAEATAVVWLCFVLVVAVFPQAVTAYGPNDQDLLKRLQGPTAHHWLGSDELGRDTWTRIAYGARVSIVVGLLSAAWAFAIGVPMGLAAGYFGGWVDRLIMRLVDGMLAFPGLILALGVVAAMGGGIGPLMLAIGISYIPVFARITHGAVLGEIGKAYVEAAASIGASPARVMLRHLLPNITSPLSVQVTVAVGLGIIVEAALSFLGVGINPPEASWGVMLKASYGYLEEAALLSIAPGVAIMLTVMSLNFIGDGIRDWFDPQSRRAAEGP